MNTTKATYWIALAVFGLALNSAYRHGDFPALHQVAGRASTTMCRIATRAEQTLAMARFLTARPDLPAEDLLASNAADMAQNQVEMLREQAQGEAEDFREQSRDKAEMLRDQLRAQAEIMRAQAQMQRAQIEQIRARVRSQVHFINSTNQRVVSIGPEGCSKVRVSVDAGPDSLDDDESTF